MQLVAAGGTGSCAFASLFTLLQQISSICHTVVLLSSKYWKRGVITSVVSMQTHADNEWQLPWMLVSVTVPPSITIIYREKEMPQ